MLASIPVHRKDIEVIVVDDCSPNERSYSQFKEKWPSIITLRSSCNKGAGAARNIGLNAAAGEYIVFGDADDEFLSSAFDTFDEAVNDSLDIIYFLSEAIQQATGEASIRGEAHNKLCLDYIADPNNDNLHKLKMNHCSPVSKIYSKRFLDRINIKFEEIFVSNDVYFNVIAAVKASRIEVMGKSVYRIYRSAESITSTMTPEKLVESLQANARLSTALKSMGVKRERAASAYIATSLSHGFPTFIKVLWIALRSDMSLNLQAALRPSRWLAFYKRTKKEKDEINAK